MIGQERVLARGDLTQMSAGASDSVDKEAGAKKSAGKGADKATPTPTPTTLARKGPYASSRRKFYGYFTVVLSLAIVTAGVMWIVYGYLPNEYYFPVSFSLLATFGVIAYVILSRRLDIS